MDQERRHTVRQYLRVLAALQIDDTIPIEVHTIDVGILGMALNGPEKLTIGQMVQLRFDVPLNGELEHVTAAGRVSYCAPAVARYKIGIRFMDLDAKARTVIAAYLLA